MTMNPFEQSTQQLLRFLTSHAEWEVIDYIRQEIQHARHELEDIHRHLAVRLAARCAIDVLLEAEGDGLLSMIYPGDLTVVEKSRRDVFGGAAERFIRAAQDWRKIDMKPVGVCIDDDLCHLRRNDAPPHKEGTYRMHPEVPRLCVVNERGGKQLAGTAVHHVGFTEHNTS